MKKLGREFFSADSVSVAKALIGKILVRKYRGKTLTGRIIETEAYRGTGDPGSHAYRSRTPRNSIMFGPPGYAYVYFCYGNHYLFNITCEPEDMAGAVLIRSITPLDGTAQMMKLRGKKDLKGLTDGPAKLTQALAIGKEMNGHDMQSRDFYTADDGKGRIYKIKATSRIGIKQGLELKWRFLTEEHK